jgi:hypothetical protein
LEIFVGSLEVQLPVLKTRFLKVGREIRVTAEQSKPFIIRPSQALRFKVHLNLKKVALNNVLHQSFPKLDFHLSILLLYRRQKLPLPRPQVDPQEVRSRQGARRPTPGSITAPPRWRR